MTRQTVSRLPSALTLIGMMSLVLSLAILGLWILAFNSGNDAAERTELFTGYFPVALGVWGIALLDLGLCLIAVVSSLLALRTGKHRTLNTTILIVGILLTLIKVWGIL